MSGDQNPTPMIQLMSDYFSWHNVKSMTVDQATKLIKNSEDDYTTWQELYHGGETFVCPFFDIDKMFDVDVIPDWEHELAVSECVDLITSVFESLGVTDVDLAVADSSRTVEVNGSNKYRLSFHIILPGLKITVNDNKDIATFLYGDMCLTSVDLNVYPEDRRLLRCVHSCKPTDSTKTSLVPITNHSIDKFFITNVLEFAERIIVPENMRQSCAKNRIIIDADGTEDVQISCKALASLLSMMHLPAEKSIGYNEWIKIGMFSKAAAGDNAFDAWHDWSSTQPGYKSDIDCLKKWKYMRPQHCGNGVGALHNIAKRCSPQRYTDWLNEIRDQGVVQLKEYSFLDDENDNIVDNIGHDLSENETELVWKAIKSISHFDVAKSCTCLLKGKYVCIDVKSDGFYFCGKNGRWIKDGDSSLRIELSQRIAHYFEEQSDILSTKAKKLEGDEASRIELDAKHAADVSNKLKDSTFKDKVIKEFKALTFDSKFMERLDADAHLVGFENGTFDLKSNTFRSINPDDYISLSTGYDYNDAPDLSKIKELQTFFADVLDIDVEDIDESGEVSITIDESKKEFFLDYIASNLVGVNRSEQIMLMIGAGRNGKGVAINLVNSTFGQYAYQPNIGIIQTAHKQNPAAPNPEVRKLKGMRIVNTSEPDENVDFDISRIRGFSGNDKIQSRGLYEKINIEFKPTFGFTISLNKLPPMSSVGRSIKDRFNFVGFERVFCFTPRAMNERKIDSSMKERFDNDVGYRQAFFYILRNIWIDKKMGNSEYTLQPPESVRNDNTEVFRNRDPVGVWVDTLTIDNNNVIPLKEAYDAFGIWLWENDDFNKMNIDEDGFKEAMQQHNYRNKQHHFRVKGSKDERTTIRGFRGIKL
jgi:putative DNA primase/helicase